MNNNEDWGFGFNDDTFLGIEKEVKTKKNNNQLESELGNLIYDGNNIDELEIENIVTIRPENIKISDKDEYDHNSFKGLIKSVIFSGTHTRYKILIKNIFSTILFYRI